MAVSPSSSDTLDVRLALPGSPVELAGARAAVVLVEPLYAGVAAALALDAGWGSAEVAERASDAAPIPLVSFEQVPPAEHQGGRCRVRAAAADLAAAARAVHGGSDSSVALVGSAVVARPLSARIAYEGFDTVVFVPVAQDGELSSDGWWVAGLLIRVLLDELDARDSRLDDAAGIAVSLAGASTDPTPALLGSRRWFAHAAAGGNEDDVRLAASVDSVGLVPRVDAVTDDSVVLVPWLA